MAFPANLTYVMGEPIKAYEMTSKPFEEMTRDDFLEIAGKVKQIMQNKNKLCLLSPCGTSLLALWSPGL